MHPTGSRKCLHCCDFFLPDARNRERQRYCVKPGCRRASRAASQAKWLAKPENVNQWKGWENVQRVQEWRKANPGYSRRRGAATACGVTRRLNFATHCSPAKSRAGRRCSVTGPLRGVTKRLGVAKPCTRGAYCAVRRGDVARGHRADAATPAIPGAGDPGHRRPAARLCKNNRSIANNSGARRPSLAGWTTGW